MNLVTVGDNIDKFTEYAQDCAEKVVCVYEINVHTTNEIQFIEEGHGINRTTFAWNRFVLVGPDQLSGNLTEAMSSLVTENKCFISRGDSSGTHIKEQEVWRSVAEINDFTFINNELGYHPDWGRLSINWTGHGCCDYNSQ